jgi:hypothetical protein
VSIEEGVSIGIALRNDGCNGGLRVTGIHLDGDFLRQQHELVLPGHGDCRCLEHFQSHISDLRIGNPDDLQNKINYYQQVIKVLSQYKEGVKALMKVDPSNVGHLQAVQRQMIQQHGGHYQAAQPLQQQQPSPQQQQQQPQRFQRHLGPTRVQPNGSMVHNVPPRMHGQNVQNQSVHNQTVHIPNGQNMAIPSGLPHRPSTYYVNQNYYVHSNQQQHYVVQTPQNHGVQNHGVQGHTVQGHGVQGAGCHLNGASGMRMASSYRIH